ncbi:DUF4279 domain-containing protein [Verrucomicrobiaceae bacterium N1E253]|uniref:DUF4279 domain-containing protein n=1 Tax=Oceaniferula marina TaxID=2748318 RepID=A0A851GIY9_9BACT|nr:DUF4279 domain-containing protein [Oceaniferula marina]NWK57778.1 DUF4279 domain-containing protein [Oceaniferula marina]
MHDDISPTEVTTRLNVEPTRQNVKGEKIAGIRRPARINGWFLSSQNKVESFDSRRHIDWILDQIYERSEELNDMMEQGFCIDITSFWVSKSANGGPTLSPYQMKRLSDLNIEVWWDIYFDDDDES